MKKNNLIIFAGFFLVLVLAGMVCAVEVTHCCERTTDGAWCQNTESENCADGYRSVPASCEATSYCKLGCCYDSQEGTCMENTPQKVCEDSNGVWEDGADCDIPQCTLGCCLIGDQAAFVTQTRCKRLSSLYGLEIDYRTTIGSEMQCILSTVSEIEGACVFEKEYEKTCLFVTKKECNEMETSSGVSNVEFHQDYLCSSEELGADCGPTEKTTCVKGRDEVYFVDSCGNLANVYDSSKINDKEYWSKIYEKSESCNPYVSNADSASCGNCDYYLGSTCKSYERSEDKKRPLYGDNICRDLSCEYQGKTYQHGETWCADAPGTDDNSPGSRYFRLVCYNGDVSVEPCADYRQEYCLESEIDGFRTAGCVVNKWENSENTDVPPGLEFWNADGSAQSICSQADEICEVTYEKKLTGDKKCVENCECLDASWQQEKMAECNALGDCGSKSNYLGY